MNDLKPFEHGEEGTHYACPEMIEMNKSYEQHTQCCGCTGHKCKEEEEKK